MKDPQEKLVDNRIKMGVNPSIDDLTQAVDRLFFAMHDLMKEVESLKAEVKSLKGGDGHGS